MKNLNEKFETIREEIDHLKKRMDSIQDILNSQEELLEILTNKSIISTEEQIKLMSYLY